MIDLRGVVHVLGWVTGMIGLMLIVPAIVDLAYDNEDWKSFARASSLAFFIGCFIVLATKSTKPISFDFRQAFLLIVLGWIVVATFGAIPFLGLGISITDSFFETMSGITTTGSTILTGLDTLPPGLLLWRSILQWIGGIGIIAIAVLILPFLRVGGMQFFKIESSGTKDEKSGMTLKTLSMLFGVYCALTLLCVTTYYLLGMNGFDAANHAMSTVSTGGYSTHDASFGYFSNAGLHWAATLFMICGAVPFFLYVKAVLGDRRAMFADQQVRGFLAILGISSILMAFWLMARQDIGFFSALTLTAFNITSVVTTTGFATTDYTAWGHGAVGMFLFLMFIGGCSGSTAGSIKVYRFQVLWIYVRAHVKKLFSPNRVVVMRYNGRMLDDDVPLGVLAFLAVFIATIGVFTVILSLMELDIVTAYSASVTAITNVGPGMGDIIGPSGTFQTLPTEAKWTLIIAMLAGRLEILSLLVFFEKDFWSE
ncbi:MAG: TrkH family potassium uptake protein [Alphaproteobacteria bacterium]